MISALIPIWRYTRAASAGLLSAAIAASASLMPAQASQTALYDFTGKSGSTPDSKLVFDASGALYGTTMYGGAHGGGTVYKLTRPASGTGPWQETVLHSFAGGADGAVPVSGVVLDAQGAVYGAVAAGGSLNMGAVFKLTPPASGTGPWTRTILHNFGNGLDGQTPQGGVVLDAHGALYGTTQYGGGHSYGIVYQLTPPVSGTGPWKETILHSFQHSNTDGGWPMGDLAIDSKGALYGTTQLGGFSLGDYGTVFKMTPPAVAGGAWTEKVLHIFKYTDGANPSYGVIIGKGGALYGVAARGSPSLSDPDEGAVFKLTPPTVAQGQWTQEVLYYFAKGNAFFPGVTVSPMGTLVFDPQGNLYGVTELGGSDGNARGGVYSLTPPASGSGPWTAKVIYNFMNCEGPISCNPMAGLVRNANGALFGTASGFSASKSNGAVFKLLCNQWSGIGTSKTCLSW
jgi:uncharacterized repeat protein (TIGR03803 family)